MCIPSDYRLAVPGVRRHPYAAIPAPPPSEMEQLRQEVARLSDENAQLQQEQTDLQMALCDTYELLLGGNDNG